MKRCVVMLLMVALALSMAASAEGLGALSDYLAAVDLSALGAGEWAEEVAGRVLSASPSKDAVISLCIEDGVLLAISVTAPQGDLCEACACAALPASGRIDAAALEPMLERGEGGDVGGVRVPILSGDVREGVYLCMADDMDALFWQPTHGGVDRHRSPVCSGMDVPRLITAAAADALGFPPCSKCAGNRE